MCGLPAIAVAATVLGTAVSAYSAYSQGQAQSKAADYNAAVARNNATVAGWNAQAAEDSQAAKTQAIVRAGEQRAGAQRAAMGASGVTLDSGSALDVGSATAADTARSAESSQYQGELSGYGYRTQQNSYLNQATLDTSTASSASTAGDISAGSSLLSGAGQVASKWYMYNNPGGSGAGGYGLGVGQGYGSNY